MNKKKYGIILTTVALIIIFVTITFVTITDNTTQTNNKNSVLTSLTFEEISNSDDIVLFDTTDSSYLFYVYAYKKDFVTTQDGKIFPLLNHFYPKSELESLYKDIGAIDDQKSVVVNPIFTAAAYTSPGFYDYFGKKCDEKCLTVPIKIDGTSGYTSSWAGLQALEILGYDVIDDLEVNNNPGILKKYDKVVVLHNEYVTKEMFDAFESHPNVIYLYPNALYAEVDYDSMENTITLIRGHQYPTDDIVNGFDWKNENTHPFEYDTECLEWEFYSIDNGWMLNCYPEQSFLTNSELIKKIRTL